MSDRASKRGAASAAENTGRGWPFVAAAGFVAAVFLFLQWLRFAEPLGLDQGLFACFGRWTLEGWLPYREMWDQKPPGLVHIYGLAFAYFAARGGLGEMWEAVFVFPRIFHAVTGEMRSWGMMFRWVPQGVVMGLPTACLAALIGVVALARGKREHLWLLVPWLLLPIAVVIIQGQRASYHYLLVVPGIALAAGCGVSALIDAWGERRARWFGLVAAVALAVVAVSELPAWRSAHLANWEHRRGAIPRARYLEHMRQGSFRPAAEAGAAALVRAKSGQGRRVLVWGLAPGVYFLADRAPATRYPFHHLFLTGERLSVAIPGLEERQQAFLERLERERPALILVGRRDVNVFEREDSYAQMVKFEAFHRIVRERYELVDELPGFFVFAEKAEEPPASPAAQ